uniref:Spermatosis associated 1 n=1 Tax=Oncorhynchus mykiss TaxID=8022 RepID=A0A8C7VAQ1_ONCMY
MESSCKSIRYPDERRLTSRKFVELHVLFVPNEQWNLKLNRVPIEAIKSFISAGFIRVYPDISLRTLRSELGILLGAERDIDKLSFLKCVGRSLALVKAKQERDLKVKYFAPPYAPQPELYLLPRVESDNTVCSQSLTPNTHSTDPQIYYTARVQGMPTGTKEPFKFPQIPQGLQPQPPSYPSPDEEAKEEESYCSTEENEEDLLSSQQSGCKKQLNHVFLPQFNLHLVFSKLFLEINGFRTDTAAKASQFCPESFCCCFPARDSWKTSYFDTKKATAPLEVTLRSLRQELEIFYNNILHQLKARDGGGKPRWRARLSSTKVTITPSTEVFAGQTVLNLGKQAATELRALKAELAQKNTQTFLSGSMGFGAGARDRPQVQSIPN